MAVAVWTSLLAFVVLAGLVAVTALMAAADASVHLVPRGRVRRLAESGGGDARALDELSERPGRVLAAKALVSAAAYATAGITTGWALHVTYPTLPLWFALVLGLLIGVLLLFVLAEALPRTLALQNPERIALAAARWALRVTRVAYPIVRALSAPFTWAAGLSAHDTATPPVPWVTEDEYRAQPGGDEEDAAREEAEDALLDAVSDFTGKLVREVMVPRTDMIAIEDSATVDDALDLIDTHGFSRLPVYRETLDDIVGIVYAKDLLLRLRDRTAAELRPASIARPAYFVPETKPVEELLIEMRRRSHMAIVADEYGGTAGLVTIEDLLEEIVGDIFDEYDREEPLVVPLAADRWRVDARMPVDELDERFGTAIADQSEAETVGGLVTELMGHIPVVGEAAAVEGLRLTVREMQGTRVRMLEVESTGTADDEEARG